MKGATHDAVVIGAGPAGSVAALLLARAGWHVALVEKAAFPRRKVCGEFLSATNQPLFRRLGLATELAGLAGPPIARMALYAGDAAITASLPRAGRAASHGYAMGRQYLDTALAGAARAAGAEMWQPWTARVDERDPGGVTRVTLRHGGQARVLAAPVVVEADGRWGKPAHDPRPRDLLGFKAHFRGAALAPDLMPLLVFPGGYGGLVTSSQGQVCFGCAVRKDVMARVHEAATAPPAAAMLRHVLQHCRQAEAILAGAALEGSWLGAGPIRPELRDPYGGHGLFRVGNAAGEAHSLVGEGMSMAMQGAWLLAELLGRMPMARAGLGLDEVGAVYRRAWRRGFVPRIAAARVYAAGAMRPGVVSVLLPLFEKFPAILTVAAGLSGKTRMLVPA